MILDFLNVLLFVLLAHLGAACLLYPLVHASIITLLFVFDKKQYQTFKDHVRHCVDDDACPAKDDRRHIIMERIFWNRFKKTGKVRQYSWLFAFAYLDNFTSRDMITQESVKNFLRNLLPNYSK